MMTKQEYAKFKENKIQGRYVTNGHIIPLLTQKNKEFEVEIIGHSVDERPIHSVTMGDGPLKVLMWSQMHGNESTTTKAVLDLINFLGADTAYSKLIHERCTLRIIPILNPDGAEAYTRVNANQIDLNRDAKDRSQPESNVLRTEYDNFAPDFCFNLHDQRTIYNVGSTAKPATLSFLAPAHNVERSISATRRTAMRLIVAMNDLLETMIPGQIGRYDDTFNDNCVGDMFQLLHTPTILFEAGHFHEDYSRERTREYLFHALVQVLGIIAENRVEDHDDTRYFEIPENQKNFFDILVQNVPEGNTTERKDIGILFSEVLANGKINFEPKVVQTGNLKGCFGHKTYDFLNASDLKELEKQSFSKLL